MTSKIRQYVVWLGLAGAVALAGCGKKPPECADPQTLKTIHDIAVDNAKKATAGSLFGKDYQDDPAKLQDGYYQALKTELVNVVTDGYDEQARKNKCRGKLTLTTAADKTFSRNVSYITQLTQDKDGGFLVEIEAFEPFVRAVMLDFSHYYDERRYKGEWVGLYSCGGIEGATEGPRGPFSMPVTLVVSDPSAAKLERISRGGGVETLTGSVRSSVLLHGSGSNNPDDVWHTEFEGEVNGLELTANGKITTEQGAPLRECMLKLGLKAR